MKATSSGSSGFRSEANEQQQLLYNEVSQVFDFKASRCEQRKSVQVVKLRLGGEEKQQQAVPTVRVCVCVVGVKPGHSFLFLHLLRFPNNEFTNYLHVTLECLLCKIEFSCWMVTLM